MPLRQHIRTMHLTAATIVAFIALQVGWTRSEVMTVPLPPQPLADALDTFAQRSGLQLVYSAQLAKGLMSQGAAAGESAEQTLRDLLRGTGLTFEFVNDRTVTVMRSAAGPQADAEVNTDAATAAQLAGLPGWAAPADGNAPPGVGPKLRIAQAEQGVSDNALAAKKDAGPDGSRGPVQLEEIVVTGSRLATKAKDGPQDVRSYGHETIERSGQTSVSDFLNTLTDVSVATTGGGEQTFAGAGTPRLHGLPAGTTLVLIDGHSVETSGGQAYFGFNVFDLNSIPLAAVERVDVLPSGSSAIYGSDGLAGVVNVILKRDFDGLEANVKYGGANGTDESDAHVALGKTWERGSVSLIGTYQHIGELEGFERKLTGTQDYRAYGGPDVRQPFCPRANVYSTTGAGLPGLGGAPFAAVPAGFTGTPSQAEFLNTAGQLNTCSYYGYISQIPSAERSGAYLNAHYELTPELEVFTQIMVSHQLVRQGEDPPIVLGLPGYTPYTVAASNPYNPFGQTVGISGMLATMGRAFDELPSTFFRPLVGLRGHAFGSWSWEVVGYEARDQSSFTQTNQLNPLAFFAALNSSNPQTALNPFTTGAPGSPALLQSLVAPDLLVRNTSSRVTGSGFLRGPLFELPGGAVEVVVGAEYDKDRLTAETVNYPQGNGSFEFQRSLYAGFAEARVPILGNHGDAAAGDTLALTLAARDDHYDDFGSKATPQVSLEWRPTSSLLFRGSYGRAFRAPSLVDLFGPIQSGGVALVSDPQHGGQTTIVNSTTGGNVNLKPETGKSTTFGVVYSSRAIPDLRLSLTQWRVEENNSVQSLLPQVLVDNASLFPGRVVRDASGNLTAVNSTYINFGDILVEGLDYQADYRFRTAVGELTPSLSATQTYRYESALLPGQPQTDRLSIANGDGNWAPRWKLNGNLGWKLGPYSAHFDARYVGSYRDYDPLPSGSYLTLGNFWLYDTSFRYSFGQALPENSWLRGAYLDVGAVNLFNTMPQFSMYNGGAVGYDPTQGDIRGRFLYTQVGVKW
jgi:iron complex outermembrane receptor protein